MKKNLKSRAEPRSGFGRDRLGRSLRFLRSPRKPPPRRSRRRSSRNLLAIQPDPQRHRHDQHRHVLVAWDTGPGLHADLADGIVSPTS